MDAFGRPRCRRWRRHRPGATRPDRRPSSRRSPRAQLRRPRSGDIELPSGGTVDWEVEVVAIVGRTARRVGVEQAWDHVAGLTVGQDLSERTSQMAGPAPQFGLAKSFPGFAPTGPWLVTVDELDRPRRPRPWAAPSTARSCRTAGPEPRLDPARDRRSARCSPCTRRPRLHRHTRRRRHEPSPAPFLQPGEILRTWSTASANWSTASSPPATSRGDLSSIRHDTLGCDPRHSHDMPTTSEHT